MEIEASPQPGPEPAIRTLLVDDESLARENLRIRLRDVRDFEVVCEIEPPTRPDLTRVRHQIGVLSRIASAFLIPDNHIGRATVSRAAKPSGRPARPW